MSTVLIIGAGGVGRVVAHKCAQNPAVFSEIWLASRTEDKCKAIASEIDSPVFTAPVDADNVLETIALINRVKPAMVINVALPYQDLSIMDACLETKVHYLDTANYEPREEAKFEYHWQWAYQDRFRERGIMALLGSGFDPGVTNVFCAYAEKHLFDEIHKIDIFDANAGDHGHPFATNFNPEINIREITQKGRYWKDGEWVEVEPMSESRVFDFPVPEVGERKVYLLYHEEMESLVKHIKGLQQIRFWMTFSESYLTHLRVLENVGLTRIDPVCYKGQEIIPLQFLKAMLPDPGSLGVSTQGYTCIGCLIEGVKDGVRKKCFIYNSCNHEDCYKEVKSQAVSYTTGVPAMIGAKLMLTKKWNGSGVFNMEQFDPDPFMNDLNEYGLPWEILEIDSG